MSSSLCSSPSIVSFVNGLCHCRELRSTAVYSEAIDFTDLLVTAVIGWENSSVISYNAVIRNSITGSVPFPAFCTSSHKN